MDYSAKTLDKSIVIGALRSNRQQDLDQFTFRIYTLGARERNDSKYDEDFFNDSLDWASNTRPRYTEIR
jgi:hypothetical protein